MLFTDEVWQRYVQKIEHNFSLKKYSHLDPYFHFPSRKDEIKQIVSSEKSVSTHPFLPFIKILVKTPRFKYLEDEREYELSTKIRPISFASHKDRYIYGFYSFALNEKYQGYIRSKGFGHTVLAYRTDLQGSCNIQFAKEVFDLMKATGECTAIALDIEGYFNNIDHDLLKKKWETILGIERLPEDQFKIYRSLTTYSYVNKKSVLRHFNINLKKLKRQNKKWQSLLELIPNDIAGQTFKEKMNLLRERDLIACNKSKNVDGELKGIGIPQGSPMSGLLSNIFLIDFDEFLAQKSVEMGFHYRRYCDDLLIICPTPDAREIEKMILDKISQMKLSIQEEKNEVTGFRQNSKGKIRAFDEKKISRKKEKVTPKNEESYYTKLQYLGFEYDGQRIYIRSSTLSRFFRKLKRRIVKTIMMANSPNSKSENIFKKQLLHKYSHLGQNNFLTYAYNAASDYYWNSSNEKKEGMNSPSIKKQLSRHMDVLKSELSKTDAHRKSWKK